MAVVNSTATEQSNIAFLAGRVQPTYPGLNIQEATHEVANGDSATSTYHVARLPSNARLSGLSRLNHDDLQTTGSPTLDIGTYNVFDGTADSATSINDGIDAANAGADVVMVKDPANMGQYIWEIAGASSDPGGYIDIRFSVQDAAIDLGGTVTTSVVYYVENAG